MTILQSIGVALLLTLGALLLGLAGVVFLCFIGWLVSFGDIGRVVGLMLLIVAALSLLVMNITDY